MWDRLSRTHSVDAVELVNEVAALTKLKPITLRAHLHRMASEGVIVAETKDTYTVVTRGDQEYEAKVRRTHYRIAPS